MSRHEIRLGEGAVERADQLLARSLAGLSRRTVQRLLDEGRITIDGRRARKGEVLHGERTLDVEVRDVGGEIAAEPEPALPILFEDEHCVAVDKPAGRPGHLLRADERGAVANFLAARFPECVGAGASPLEVGLVHRLDTETSGVLLAARTREAWLALREQFRAGRIGKRYLAAVHGLVDRPGEVRRPIARLSRDSRRVRVLDDGSTVRAQPAITRYQPLRRSEAFTLLEVEIPTGVRHQIRAHLAAIGHPVVGDDLYRRDSGGDSPEIRRHLLHAKRLVFEHPVSGRRIEVESLPPDDFQRALRQLGIDGA